MGRPDCQPFICAVANTHLSSVRSRLDSGPSDRPAFLRSCYRLLLPDFASRIRESDCFFHCCARFTQLSDVSARPAGAPGAFCRSASMHIACAAIHSVRACRFPLRRVPCSKLLHKISDGVHLTAYRLDHFRVAEATEALRHSIRDRSDAHHCCLAVCQLSSASRAAGRIQPLLRLSAKVAAGRDCHELDDSAFLPLLQQNARRPFLRKSDAVASLQIEDKRSYRKAVLA